MTELPCYWNICFITLHVCFLIQMFHFPVCWVESGFTAASKKTYHELYHLRLLLSFHANFFILLHKGTEWLLKDVSVTSTLFNIVCRSAFYIFLENVLFTVVCGQQQPMGPRVCGWNAHRLTGSHKLSQLLFKTALVQTRWPFKYSNEFWKFVRLQLKHH